MKNTTITNLSDVLGWLGTLSYIVAYLLLSLGKLKAEQKTYHLLNILGALGLIVNAIHLDDYPNIIVNMVWFAIGFMGLIFIARKKV
jgi:hypothetical protein